MQKLESCAIRDPLFLRNLAEGVNLSFRYHGDKNVNDLMKLLRRKLGPEKWDTVFKMYLTCYQPEDIIPVIKPKGMSEIVGALESFFNDYEQLYEVTVGLRRCDVVILSGSRTIAVEVKSALDKVTGALPQLEYYKKWANEVYLAYDAQHDNTVKKLPFIEKGVGLLQFSENEIHTMYKSSFYQQDKEALLSLMTYEYLKKVALKYGIKNRGGKKAIVKRLGDVITEHDTKDLFQGFLKKRASL